MARGIASFGERRNGWQATAWALSAAAMLSSIASQAAQAQDVVVGSSDNGGPDDEQEQSDLTAMTLTCPGSPTSVIPFSFQLDPVINSGNNSSDVSILFDTDNDGNANYSYVITLGPDPAGGTQFAVLGISLQRGRNDSSPIKIAGNKTTFPIGTTTATVGTATNPFDGGSDTLVTLDLDFQAIANSDPALSLANVRFLNLTTIPSSSATSDPKDVLLATEQAYTADDAGTTDVDTTIAVDTQSNDSLKVDWSTAVITSPPSHGTATINADGTISYVPNGDYTGIDTLSYSATATDCSSYTANVTITINGIAAVDDSAKVVSTWSGLPAAVSVFDNDSIDGVTASASNTTLALARSSSLPPELTFSTTTGQVGVAAGALPGAYTFDYQLCRAGAPSDCKIATVTVEVIGVDLVTTKELASGDTTPVAGDTVTFTISVTNNGAADATGVSLTDLLPAGLSATAINGTVSAGSYDAGTGLWSIGTLPDGATATLTIEGTVDSGQGGQTITNAIADPATGNETDPTTTGDDLTESVTVTPQADLSIIKTNGTTAVFSGSTTTYTLTVTHEGGDPIKGAVVTDTPGAGLTCDAVDTVTITGDGVPAGSFTIADLTGGGIALDTLTSGQSTTLSYSCQVN